MIENGFIKPSERKTEAVCQFSEPENVKQVQSFLGFTGYFRKFVAGYAEVARPLSNLLRAGVKFCFGPEQKRAFDQLKCILAGEPMLKIYRLGARTELHTDASKWGFGAVLLQENSEDQRLHPIYFASGKTTPAEEKYSIYRLEVLAIIRSLKKFRQYLLGIVC